MLVPKLDETLKPTLVKKEDTSLTVSVNENNYADFRTLYMDILDEDDKAIDEYVKYIVKLVRQSYEYRQYIKILKTEFDLTKCAFFKNLDITDMKKVGFEMHHYPFTIYDICLIVLTKRIQEQKEDPTNDKKYNKVLNPFSIAKEVLRLHYQGKVGLVPLSITPHELYHAGNLFIPLTNEYVFGNYQEFIDEYDVNKIGNYGEVLKLIQEKTNEIMDGEINLDLSKLQIKKVYLEMKNQDFLKKIKMEENDEKK
jgi:hypothetical protein